MSVSKPAAEPAARDESPERLPLGVRLVTLVVILVPLLGIGGGVVFLWGWGVSWADLGLLMAMYFLTAVGITVGFHRLFVHRSFETYAPVKLVLAALGSMAVQAPL